MYIIASMLLVHEVCAAVSWHKNFDSQNISDNVIKEDIRVRGGGRIGKVLNAYMFDERVCQKEDGKFTTMCVEKKVLHM